MINIVSPQRKILYVLLIPMALFLLPMFLSSQAYGQDETEVGEIGETEGEEVPQDESVELNGDVVEYARDKNVVIAEGNVELLYQGTTLTCDKVEFSRDEKIAYAQGNVRLTMKKGTLTGEKLTYNFGTGKGTINDAQIDTSPLYGAGRTADKVAENQIVLKDAYMTTCDHDKPHFRVASKKIDVYPQDKMIARQVKFKLGSFPVLYLPKFSQNLNDKEPQFVITPGFDKEWGIFALTQWRMYLNENVKATLRLDAREKLDIAEGVDFNYKVPNKGDGVLKLYYTKERRITSDRFFQERPSPTIERERYRAEWRHKWEIDSNTEAIWQYYRLSDSEFLEDYYEKESEEDINPDTFFLMTKILPKGTFSFRTEKRVNRFETRVERLPELRYNVDSLEIAESGLYYKNVSTLSYLRLKDASPSEVRRNTMRFDLDNQVSYPMKVGFIEITPFVGGENTYYSKTKDPEKFDSIRGIFKTGASLSTKFFRIFDTEVDSLGYEVNQLRHIITPSIDYRYNTKPTLDPTQLDSFDGIDGLDIGHVVTLALENKLQTKRDKKSVDLIRTRFSSDYPLKQDPNALGFNTFNTEMDFKPTDWFTLFSDASYDWRNDRLTTSNFDTYFNNGEKWALGVGKRFQRLVDDQLTTNLQYKVNPKWLFTFYDRFDTEHGKQKEFEMLLTRDLHEWEMDLVYNDTKAEGKEIMIIFRLKAFPDIGLDFGKGFAKRKRGAQ